MHKNRRWAADVRSILTLMGNLLIEMRFTLAGVFLGTGLILSAVFTDIDLVRINLNLLEFVHRREVDDLLTGLALMLAGLAVDRLLSRNRRRRRQHAEIEAQKIRTHKATMRTVQDIVNNFLNNLMLFEMPAKDNMPPGSLDTVEELIQHTARQLRSLGDLESVVETSLAAGIGIEYPQR
jgi:hypothetical protein